MPLPPVRRSGLQQDIINLYRQCFRAAKLKPEVTGKAAKQPMQESKNNWEFF